MLLLKVPVRFPDRVGCATTAHLRIFVHSSSSDVQPARLHSPEGVDGHFRQSLQDSLQWYTVHTAEPVCLLDCTHCTLAGCVLLCAGVVGYYSADDVPGDNMIGPIMHDEEVFATKEVTCVGQVSHGVTRGDHVILQGRICA